MSDELDFKLDTKKLDQLIAAMKGALPNVRVGVLGEKAMRGDGKGSQTNATIGAIHEFGGSKMPMRSFLRVPISENLQKRMESSGAFDKDTLAKVIKDKSIRQWLNIMGKLAQMIVTEAFDTGGFGKWPAWKTPGYKNEGGRLLQDTGELRESITYEVK